MREVAQCPEEDEDAFQDITKHRFFNTNNLWLRLDKLLEAMDAAEGGASSGCVPYVFPYSSVIYTAG